MKLKDYIAKSIKRAALAKLIPAYLPNRGNQIISFVSFTKNFIPNVDKTNQRARQQTPRPPPHPVRIVNPWESNFSFYFLCGFAAARNGKTWMTHISLSVQQKIDEERKRKMIDFHNFVKNSLRHMQFSGQNKFLQKTEKLFSFLRFLQITLFLIVFVIVIH